MILSQFSELCKEINKAKGVTPYEGVLIALDPGETTGVAVFSVTDRLVSLVHTDQLKTWPFEDGFFAFQDLLHNYCWADPLSIVHEAYRVYEWKAQHHSWSDVPTLQLIGCVKTLAMLETPRKPKVYVQTAQVAKNFCTDEFLKRAGCWKSGERHTRDAIRHGLYFLAFGPEAKSRGSI